MERPPEKNAHDQYRPFIGDAAEQAPGRASLAESGAVGVGHHLLRTIHHGLVPSRFHCSHRAAPIEAIERMTCDLTSFQELCFRITSSPTTMQNADGFQNYRDKIPSCLFSAAEDIARRIVGKRRDLLSCTARWRSRTAG